MCRFPPIIPVHMGLKKTSSSVFHRSPDEGTILQLCEMGTGTLVLSLHLEEMMCTDFRPEEWRDKKLRRKVTITGIVLGSMLCVTAWCLV